jgi:predicted naringenin-chalcone synthase/malonyl CoA-acyl carrier protein transacylase/ubiquinone/menaquinone biosynthesis C-methylase UbiE/acyl carrier protein
MKIKVRYSLILSLGKLIGVNSFGFGGTNVHVILESHEKTIHQQQEKKEVQNTPYSLFFSSKTKDGLKRTLDQYQSILDTQDLPSLSYSTRKRHHFEEYRTSVTTTTTSSVNLKDSILFQKKELKKKVFVFPGQGVDIVSGCKFYLEKNEIFRNSFLKYSNTLFSELNLLDEFYQFQLNNLKVSQPLIFVTQLCLVDVLKSMNIEPDALIGHSLGEITSCVVSGILSLEDARDILLERSKMEPGGGMLIARINQETLKKMKQMDGISIAAENDSNSITFSSLSKEKLTIFSEELKEKNVSFKFLEVEYSFHSNAVDSMEMEFKEKLKHVNKRGTIKIPLYSTTLGRRMKSEEEGEMNDFFYKNLRNTVQFKQAMESIPQDEFNLYFIISPRDFFTSSIKQMKKNAIVFVLNEALESNLFNEMNYTPPLSSMEENSFVSLPNYSWKRKWNVQHELNLYLKEYGTHLLVKCLEPLLNSSLFYSLNELHSLFQVKEKYKKLFNHLISTLNLFHLDEQHRYQWIKKESTFKKNLQWNESFSNEIQLMETCGINIMKVWSEKKSSIELLFPNGELNQVENIYEKSYFSKIYNEKIADFFKTNTRKNTRILEIGGGTGGLTSYILPHLKNGDKYCFTDISNLFLSRGKKKFKDYESLISFHVLDIERDPCLQGFKENSFDFIICANVIHSTMSIEASLKNIYTLLNSNHGKLILLEIVNPHLFFDLTFGLTEGWWRFNDFRQYPLLSFKEWDQELNKLNFKNTTSLSGQTSGDEELQCVILSSKVGGEEVLSTTNVLEEELSMNVLEEKESVTPLLDDSTLKEIKETLIHEKDEMKFKFKLKEFIVQLLKKILILEELSNQVSLQKLGMDSLMFMEIRNIIKKELNLTMDISQINENTTLEHLVDILCKEHWKQEEEPMKEEEEEEFNISHFETQPPFILGMGLGVPAYCHQQVELEKIASNYYFEKYKNEKYSERIHKIYSKSEIKQRHSVYSIYDVDHSIFNSFQSRNEIYEVEAVKLAFQSASNALKDWGGDKNKITHLVSVSTTGTKIPGIEFELIKLLGLPSSTQRIAINFMGCFGALPGIKTASAFAKLNPKNRVLLVCTEICSVHLEDDPTDENFVSSAIFADGSSAAILGCEPKKEEVAYWEIQKIGSLAMENSLDKMYWKVTDKGWRLGLSKDIPVLIHDHIRSFVKHLLGTKDFSSFDFALHPGGKSILLAIENALELSKIQTKESWNVMRDYGNMSSSTILYVLNAMRYTSTQEYCSCLVFGPGLVIEGGLLRKVNSKK